jgi:class 3 adenylate cyclase
MLRACLAAVDVGLLEMSWDLVCPSCQTGTGQVAHLYDLGQEAHCGYCDIGWNLSFDESVEAVFRPHPSVRKLEAAQFCSAGPSRATHVHTQRLLLAGATVDLDAPTEPGTWNLFLRGGARCPVAIHPGGPPTCTVRLGDSGDPAPLRLAPGGTITVQSAVSDDRHVKLERLAIANEAATAHLLSLDPDFRRRFSGEVLGPGRALKVARAALIFTDLSGSTALYAKDGDAAAWRVVREHFDLLERIIHTNQGTIVKTIGDAVMAAFETEAEAIAAGADMQRAWPDFVAKVGVVDTLQLRVGVHAGPAYAVTANGNLDYFGQTVNTAARLCGQARGGEVVLGPDLLSVAHTLTGGSLRSKGLVPLKGIPAPIELFAWTSGTPLVPETPAP